MLGEFVEHRLCCIILMTMGVPHMHPHSRGHHLSLKPRSLEVDLREVGVAQVVVCINQLSSNSAKALDKVVVVVV
jgi:hypothetical protein